MFQSKTLFILGAGSSHEFGLPLGKELKDLIIEEFELIANESKRNISVIYNQIKDYSNKDKYIDEFTANIKGLRIEGSIDILLSRNSNNKNQQKCGKCGIVKCILDAERKILDEEGEIKSIENSWYPVFWQLMSEGIGVNKAKTIFDNVYFINFNYDRCMEHLLFNSIQNVYRFNESEIKDIMKNSLKIVHPYGTVGKLPWQVEKPSDAVEFGEENANIMALSDNILTFSEDDVNDSVKNDIAKYTSDAEVIVFLGFHFHKQNFDLLKLENAKKFKKIILYNCIFKW